MKEVSITTNNQALLRDESRLTGFADRVLTPETGDEAIQCVRTALKAGEKLTVRGGGTGLNGGCVPSGGLVLDMSGLTGLGEIEGDSLWAEAGVMLETVAAKAAGAGLRFPPDPTEQSAMVGGMFATGGAGPSALHFGPSSRYVSALDWVTPTGAVWHIQRGEHRVTGGKVSLPDGGELDLTGLDRGLPVEGFHEGMDLIDCLAGSEGWLGVAVSLRLTLLPMPGDLWGVVFFFENSAGAVRFGEELRGWDPDGEIRLTAAEFYDGGALKLLEEHRENPLLTQLPSFPEGAKAALYVELEGEDPDKSADALMELLDRFDRCGGAEDHTWAENGPAGVKKFRDMRHAIPTILNEMGEIYPRSGPRYEADFAGQPGSFGVMLSLYREMEQRFGVDGVIYGHLLDNKLRLALTPRTQEEKDRCPKLMDALAERAAAEGGKLAGEYGVGRTKRKLVGKFLTPQAAESLRRLCRTLDPTGMMEK